MRETWVQPLGQEDPLEKAIATYPSILALEIPWTESLADYSPWGHKAVGVVNTIYLSLKVAKSRMSTVKKIDNNKC